MATEEDGDHYDKRRPAGEYVQDESDEEVDYHYHVKEHLAHKDEEVAYHVKEQEEEQEVDYHYHVEEHLAHEGARRVQVDATQLDSTRV